MSRPFDMEPLEDEARKLADFAKIEATLFERLTKAGVSSVSTTALVKMPSVAIEGIFGFLGDRNPFAKNASANQNDVLIFDNTAFRSSDASTWRAEIEACFFQHGRGDLTAAVAALVDTIGLDGEPGEQELSKKLIAERLKPFIDAVAPARILPVVVESSGQPMKKKLGPSNISGITSQVLEVGGASQKSGENNKIRSDPGIAGLSQAVATTRLAGPEGWMVSSLNIGDSYVDQGLKMLLS